MKLMVIILLKLKYYLYFRNPKKKHSTFSSLKQALMSVFVIEAADLQVLLAQAEYLQPGFYCYVMSF